MDRDETIRNIAKAVIELNKALAAARVGPAVVIGLPKHHLNALALFAVPDAKERQGIASIAGVALIPYEREHAPPIVAPAYGGNAPP